jgi:hypothetical protein
MKFPCYNKALNTDKLSHVFEKFYHHEGKKGITIINVSTLCMILKQFPLPFSIPLTFSLFLILPSSFSLMYTFTFRVCPGNLSMSTFSLFLNPPFSVYNTIRCFRGNTSYQNSSLWDLTLGRAPVRDFATRKHRIACIISLFSS